MGVDGLGAGVGQKDGAGDGDGVGEGVGEGVAVGVFSSVDDSVADDCVVVHEVEEWVGEGVGCEESLCLLLRMNAKESLASSECYDVEF